MIAVSQIGQAYWSDELGEGQIYGDVTVTLESIKKIIGLVIREFSVRHGSKVLFGVLFDPVMCIKAEVDHIWSKKANNL